MPETITLLGSTKSKITKNENGENVPRLEITEVILINYYIVNNEYQQDSRVLYKFANPRVSLGTNKMVSKVTEDRSNLI